MNTNISYIAETGEPEYFQKETVESLRQEIRENKLPIRLHTASVDWDDREVLGRQFVQDRPDIILLETDPWHEPYEPRASEKFAKYVARINLTWIDCYGIEPVPPIVVVTRLHLDSWPGREHAAVLENGACAIFPLMPKRPDLTTIVNSTRR